MNFSDHARAIARKLSPAFPEQELALINAWWLLEILTHKSQAQLIITHDNLTVEQEDVLTEWITQIIDEHKPIQYVLGQVPFLDLKIHVKPPVLIPRPETEEWCASLIALLHPAHKKNSVILDLCTGSGCIALALAQSLPQATITAVDIADYALDLARENAGINGISNCHFVQSDLYEALPQGIVYDLITANPPYISETAWRELDPEVKNWEDYGALVAPQEGLALIKKIIDGAIPRLAPYNGVPQLWIEIGYDQGQIVAQMMRDAGLHNVDILCDYAGHDRVVRGSLA